MSTKGLLAPTTALPPTLRTHRPASPEHRQPVPAVVVLSTADFESQLWTNKQHLAVGLAEHTDVSYIESLGLRRPKVSRQDGLRVLARLRGGPTRGSATAPERLRVVRPLTIPLHDAAAARWVNRRMVARLDLPQLENSTLWTFSPLTYGLESRARSVVYHSVDLLHEQPGFPVRQLLEAERSLLQVATHVIASSTGVRDHLQSLGRDDVHLWENVADTRLFRSTSTARRPRAIFAGNLTPTKVDLALLLAVADTGIETVIAGPRGIDGTQMPASLQKLLEHPHVTYLGPLSPTDLAAECAQSMVGLIPYGINRYTAGVFPLKVYEYLAAGLAVVSTDLKSLSGCPDVLRVPDGEDFAAVVSDQLRSFTTSAAAARSDLAGEHSWPARMEQVTALLRSSDEPSCITPGERRTESTRHGGH